MAELTVTNLTKTFGDVVAVRDFSLHVADGEFVVLVGPSGCGKTTMLRMIAGLERPSSGSVQIGDRTVNHLPARKRDVAMVFQDFALYPNRSVFGNLAFALELRGVARPEIQQRVQEIADLVGVSDLLQRLPSELSGGQQQRIALGRAMVRRPALFLLDEPFSNLDTPLRDGLRSELVLLQQRMKTTTLHVTHDQIEAMQLGQRVIVMNQGRIQQVDTPDGIYDRPANLLVARFFGTPPMNCFPATLIERGDTLWIDAQDFRISIATNECTKYREAGIRNVVLGIRAEDIRVVNNGIENAEGVWSAQIKLIQSLGSDNRLELESESHRFAARVPRNTMFRIGDYVGFTVDSQRCHLFDAETERRMY